MTKLLLLVLFMFSFTAFAADPIDVIREVEVQHGVECVATHDSTALCLNKLCWYNKTFACSGESVFGLELKIQSKKLADDSISYRVRSVNFVR